MTTPYEEKEWLLTVILHNGTYYLEKIALEERRENPSEDETTCWGWKFEQYLTADCEDGEPNTDEPYSNCEAFYTVVKTRLNDHTLVYSGEVDVINSNGNYMEFKTNKEFDPKGHVKRSFKRYKTKKWWAQSNLIGVKEIVCGYNDGNGVVKRLEIFKTEDLPMISSDIHNPWKANICTNFLDQFLSFIKSLIKTDDHKVVHTVKLTPQKGLIGCSLLQPDSKNNFLPQWYICGTI